MGAGDFVRGVADIDDGALGAVVNFIGFGVLHPSPAESDGVPTGGTGQSCGGVGSLGPKIEQIGDGIGRRGGRCVIDDEVEI